MKTETEIQLKIADLEKKAYDMKRMLRQMPEEDRKLSHSLYLAIVAKAAILRWVLEDSVLEG